MNNLKRFLKLTLCIIFMFSCGSKDSDIDASPDMGTNNNPKKENNDNINMSEKSHVELNMHEIIQDLQMDIKKLRSELDYQHENLSKIEAKTQLWANPFSIYNKEIVINNGSSIFGKIVYQDQDIMKIETLIGQLIIDRNTITRVVNQVSAYANGETNTNNLDLGNTTESAGVNLIQKRVENLSAHLVLVGDIKESKDGSGNTVLTGEVKNVGNKRADFSKIIFTFRMNWQGDSKSLTTFVNGATNTFDTGISSDNSILPHSVGNFELIIPSSFGSFIGYNYDIDWSQYDG